jgi:lysophospholipase L1-like esterase
VTAVALRRRVASYLLTVLAGVLVTAGCGSSGASRADSAYVAMGDSYSSGAGIAPVTDAACSRSSANYASLVARDLDYASFSDVTCGGAATTDLRRAQPGTGNGPQLDPLGPRTRLVTLTLGLNDDNVSYALLYSCLSWSGPPSAQCQQLIAAPEAAAQAEIAGLAARVESALRLIRSRAPRARVVLVGYPRILPDSGDCPARLPLAQAMEVRLRETMHRIGDDWRRAAERTGADYVDAWTMSNGHEVCSDDPWVNGATSVPGGAAPLHPLGSFHRAIADAIVKLVGKQ